MSESDAFSSSANRRLANSRAACTASSCTVRMYLEACTSSYCILALSNQQVILVACKRQ